MKDFERKKIPLLMVFDIFEHHRPMADYERQQQTLATHPFFAALMPVKYKTDDAIRAMPTNASISASDWLHTSSYTLPAWLSTTSNHCYELLQFVLALSHPPRHLYGICQLIEPRILRSCEHLHRFICLMAKTKEQSLLLHGRQAVSKCQKRKHISTNATIFRSKRKTKANKKPLKEYPQKIFTSCRIAFSFGYIDEASILSRLPYILQILHKHHATYFVNRYSLPYFMRWLDEDEGREDSESSAARHQGRPNTSGGTAPGTNCFGANGLLFSGSDAHAKVVIAPSTPKAPKSHFAASAVDTMSESRHVSGLAVPSSHILQREKRAQ